MSLHERLINFDLAAPITSSICKIVVQFLDEMPCDKLMVIVFFFFCFGCPLMLPWFTYIHFFSNVYIYTLSMSNSLGFLYLQFISASCKLPSLVQSWHICTTEKIYQSLCRQFSVTNCISENGSGVFQRLIFIDIF